MLLYSIITLFNIKLKERKELTLIYFMKLSIDVLNKVLLVQTLNLLIHYYFLLVWRIKPKYRSRFIAGPISSEIKNITHLFVFIYHFIPIGMYVYTLF